MRTVCEERDLSRCVRQATLWLALTVTACGPRGEGDRPLLNTAEGVAYVGIEACQSCHLDKHATHGHTGMGRAFYALDARSVVEDFDRHNEFVVEPLGLHYRVEQREGRYYQREFLLDAAGRDLAAEEHELVWVIGSNHHARSYVIERDGKLFQAPACWYPEPQRWDLCPGYEHDNLHFSREITQACIHCHNGRMETLEGERNAFREPYPLGIDCERCHGPGQLHVEYWSKRPEAATGELDPTIVNPRRLPLAERLDVCFQCHLGDARSSRRIPLGDRSLEEFRPGLSLTEHVALYRYAEPTQWDFGLSSQADRMLLSRCFLESGGGLECLTCHDPHVTVYHPERPANFFRRRCLGCHQLESCNGPERAREATEPADDCVACHMRRAEPDDQRHTEFTDHWIRRNIDLAERDHRRDYEITEVLPDRHAGMPVELDAYYRGRAFALLAPDAPLMFRPELLESAEAAYLRAIDAGLQSADVWYYLGTARRDLGRDAQALEAFRRAFELEPDHFDAAYAVGQARLAAGDTAGALAIFEKLLEQHPRDARALGETGRALAARGRHAEALELYRFAIERDPWKADLRTNYGRLLAVAGRLDEAAREAEVAVSLDPDDDAGWSFYENVMRAAGRPGAASEAARQRARIRQAARRPARGAALARSPAAP